MGSIGRCPHSEKRHSSDFYLQSHYGHSIKAICPDIRLLLYLRPLIVNFQNWPARLDAKIDSDFQSHCSSFSCF